MKAVLMMYKVFLRFPEALRPAFPKLKEKLEDPDPGKIIITLLHYVFLFELVFHILLITNMFLWFRIILN